LLALQSDVKLAASQLSEAFHVLPYNESSLNASENTRQYRGNMEKDFYIHESWKVNQYGTFCVFDLDPSLAIKLTSPVSRNPPFRHRFFFPVCYIAGKRQFRLTSKNCLKAHDAFYRNGGNLPTMVQRLFSPCSGSVSFPAILINSPHEHQEGAISTWCISSDPIVMAR